MKILYREMFICFSIAVISGIFAIGLYYFAAHAFMPYTPTLSTWYMDNYKFIYVAYVLITTIVFYRGAEPHTETHLRYNFLTLSFERYECDCCQLRREK